SWPAPPPRRPYPPSLHDALPICTTSSSCACSCGTAWVKRSALPAKATTASSLAITWSALVASAPQVSATVRISPATSGASPKLRSEEHASELQSRENLVCRLLLE